MIFRGRAAPLAKASSTEHSIRLHVALPVSIVPIAHLLVPRLSPQTDAVSRRGLLLHGAFHDQVALGVGSQLEDMVADHRESAVLIESAGRVVMFPDA